MKNASLLFLLIVLTSGTASASFSQDDGYEIRISFEKNISDVLYLAVDDDYSKHIPQYSIVDSVLVAGENAVFKGSLDYPTSGRLFFKNSTGLFVFLLFNSTYEMVMNTDKMWETKIISVEPEVLSIVEKYKYAKAPLTDKMNQAYESLIKAEEIGNDTLIDYYSELNQAFVKEADQLTGNFIKEHPDSFISLLLFREFLEMDIAERRKLYVVLTEENKDHPLAQRLYFELFQKDTLIAEGHPALPFLLKDPHDIFYELNDFKDRYLLMFFWASWCDRCMSQFVSYGELYYRSRGKPLEIVSVSIENDHQVWLDLLETHNLPWVNLIDAKDENGWRLFEYYDNQSVPFNILIGKSGEIVKLNVSLQELEEILEK